MLADYRTAPVSPQVRAMCAYLEKLTLTPGALTVEDGKALRAAGVSKEAAEDALFVAFCFNQIVRIADALGWEVSSREAFAAGAKALLKFGYVLPFHGKPKK